MYLVLIACAKSKLNKPGKMLPKVLYRGTLFQKRVAYAERMGHPWAVLSAKHGLWIPDEPKEWYDVSFPSLSKPAKRVWPMRTALQLVKYLWSEPTNLKPSQVSVEIHACPEYLHPLDDILRGYGINVIDPPSNRMAIGRQIGWYSRQGFPADEPFDQLLEKISITKLIRLLGTAGWSLSEVLALLRERVELAESSIRCEVLAGRKRREDLSVLTDEEMQSLESRRKRTRHPLFGKK